MYIHNHLKLKVVSLFQGFSVALLYCFLNSEVKQAVRHRLQTWNDSRHISSTNSMKGNRRYVFSSVLYSRKMLSWRALNYVGKRRRLQSCSPNSYERLHAPRFLIVVCLRVCYRCLVSAIWNNNQIYDNNIT